MQLERVIKFVSVLSLVEQSKNNCKVLQEKTV
jgi:hypothetical protein